MAAKLVGDPTPFLRRLLRGVPSTIGIGLLEQGVFELVVFNDSVAAARWAREVDKRGKDVYVTVGLFDMDATSRAAVGVRGIVGLWLDIDLMGSPQRGGKVKKSGAPDLRSAVALARSIVDPTLIVFSGGGVQAWHLFDQPWIFESDDDREEAAALARDWVAAHRRLARFAIDAVQDLARVMRVAGVHNHKTGKPRRVEARSKQGWRRHRRQRLRALVEPLADEPSGPDVSIDGYDTVAKKRIKKLLAVAAVHSVVRSTESYESLSERDFALMLAAMEAGASDSEAAALLIRVRDDKKGRRTDYVKRTVASARRRFVGSSNSLNSTFGHLKLADAAYHGVIGEIVLLIEPHTEADPAGILIQMLAMAGSTFGRAPGYLVGADRHGCNLFVLVVGDTSKGRKGVSLGQARKLIEPADPTWQIVTGLSTGEGLIHHVRDPRTLGKKSDPGVADKRLMVTETEFASVLRRMRQQGNSLGVVIRQAWDGQRLGTLTKRDAEVATNAHVSIIVHITKDELLAEIDKTDLVNGFGNRFLCVAVSRTRLLPFGGDLASIDWPAYVARVRAAIVRAHSRDQVDLGLTPAAAERWVREYERLSEPLPGAAGAVTSRAEAQVRRIAVIYAVLDLSDTVDLPHLEAALAVWDYCERSAIALFGTSRPPTLRDQIKEFLDDAGDSGLTRTEVHNLLQNNATAAAIKAALEALVDRGHATAEKARSDSGRSVTRWYAATKETNSTNADDGTSA